MRRQHRIIGRKQISLVQKQGKTWSNRFVVLKAVPNNLEWSRYAFLVGKRLGKAVVRNRVRRRLRELMRTTAVQGGWDMLVIARVQSVDVPFADLKSATEELLVQSGLLSQKHGEKL